MNREIVKTIALRGLALVVVLCTWQQAQTQDQKESYPSMAPVAQYMMERQAEITLARSAAPESISRDAEVLVLGQHGYESAVKGKNGFVCLVERSWAAGIDDPVFWNPKLRGAICFNAAAVRSYVPITVKKTELILAGRSGDESSCFGSRDSELQKSLRQTGTVERRGNRFQPREESMSNVRVLVGTRKGAFILTSDGKREKWDVSGPHFAGWEMYHVKGSPADPNRLYASQSSGWFGQLIQRSDDGGKTWHQPGTPPGEPPAPGPPKGVSNKFVYDVSAETGKPLTTHQFYDGTQHPWEFKRVWHLEPSLTDPDTVYAGVEDAALFRSTDGGENWKELSGLRGHGTGPKWQPGAGGMCLHTIILDPSNPDRIFIAISAAGAFRTDDGGKPGSPSTVGCIRNTFPIQRPRLATAFTTLP
jgi:hypothetical protein